MYAVVRSGGKQYRVEPGATLSIDRLNGEPGSRFTFDEVLLVASGEQVSVGMPTVAGASVSATVLGAESGDKIVVFKFRPKVHYRRRTGQRSRLTRVRIDEISAPGIKAERAEAAAKGEARRGGGRGPAAKTASVKAGSTASAKRSPRARPAARKTASRQTGRKPASRKAKADEE